MFRRLRINTQERAVSTDVNRLQAFAIRGYSEVVRRSKIGRTSPDAMGTVGDPTTLGTPADAAVLAGLLVRPQLASLNAYVDAGAVAIVDPTNAGFDDSACAVLEFAGQTTPGALAMTGNASGQVRVDVIECHVNAVPSIVTDSRDIFDPTTGLFVASVVTKELQPQLEFRVRQGTPGSGYPGHASGWLPLAVAIVPNGATTNDAIDFWDVRPMAEDAAVATTDSPLLSQQSLRWRRASSTSWMLSGHLDGTYLGRRVGGTFPETDLYLLRDTAIAEASATYVYAYLAFPLGLPRWARYSTAGSGSRIPKAPFGMLVLSLTPPLENGTPSSALALTNLGLSGTTTSTACAIFVNDSGSLATFGEAVMQNGTVNFAGVHTNGPPSDSLRTFSGSISLPTVAFDLASSGLPPNAKAVWISFADAVVTLANSYLTTEFRVEAHYGNAGTPSTWIYGGEATVANPTGSTHNLPIMSAPIRVPLGPGRSAPPVISWDIGFGNAANAPTMKLLAIEF